MQIKKRMYLDDMVKRYNEAHWKRERAETEYEREMWDLKMRIMMRKIISKYAD